MKNKIGLLFCVVLALSVVLGACAPEAATEPEVEVVDEPTQIPPTAVPTEETDPDPIVLEDDLG